MFSKILVANRGEIACRVIKTAKKLGIATVAIYSEADKNSLAVRLADEAYLIGPAPSQQSYLNGEKIIAIAKQAGATAIHPGYGFLSENTAFARQCQQQQICFIGPPVTAIELMGSKAAAKQLAETLAIPLVPGYHADAQDDAALLKASETIGFPILIKAAAGGGGKGMRVVANKKELSSELAAARREAMKSFKDDILILEKYLPKPRHIEVQVFGDTHGNYVYLFERDCSIQRRYQKIIEEAPAIALSKSLQEAMGLTAIKLAKAVNYTGAGTIEFLLDEDKFYFMEMNTRLQVEHPVTEMITQIDLVEWQLRVAAGEPLPLLQHEIELHGHAIEVRIYAEDTSNQFLPSIGTLAYLQTPAETDAIRLDTGVIEGDTISPYYDPMLAKLIVWGEDRQIAIRKMQRALLDYQVIGVKTNVAFLKNLLAIQDYQQGNIDTSFIPQHEHALFKTNSMPLTAVCIAGIFYHITSHHEQGNSNDLFSPWLQQDGWNMGLGNSVSFKLVHAELAYAIQIKTMSEHYAMTVNGTAFLVSSVELEEERLFINIDDQSYHALIVEMDEAIHVIVQGESYAFSNYSYESAHTEASDSGHQLTSPMPGTIIAIMTEAGKKVQRGDQLLIVEAMKMEHAIKAPSDGVIASVNFKVGDQVNEGVELLSFEKEAS